MDIDHWRALVELAAMLNEPVLVLNRSWIAVHVATARRAITMLFEGTARAVCHETFRTFDFEDWKAHSSTVKQGQFIHSPGFRLHLPEVVVLAAFNRVMRRPMRFNRRNVFLRDGHTCQYCGRVFAEKELSLEHIVPVSKGGENTWENVVTACKVCNRRKANRTPEQAGMPLLCIPHAPPALTTELPSPAAIKQSWQRFLVGSALDPVAAQLVG